MEQKLVWQWTEWTEDNVQDIWLPALYLTRLPGKTSLYLTGEFTAFDPVRLTPLAQELISVIWSSSEADGAFLCTAPPGETRVAEQRWIANAEELSDSLGDLFAMDANYIVHVGELTFAEQDGEILVIEAPRPELERLFDDVSDYAQMQGWTFIDVVDD